MPLLSMIFEILYRPVQLIVLFVMENRHCGIMIKRDTLFDRISADAVRFGFDIRNTGFIQDQTGREAKCHGTVSKHTKPAGRRAICP